MSKEEPKMIKILYTIAIMIAIMICFIVYDIQSIAERPIDAIYKIGIPIGIFLMIYHIKYKRR